MDHTKPLEGSGGLEMELKGFGFLDMLGSPQSSELPTRVTSPNRAKTDIFHVFRAFLGPGTMSKAFSRP